MNLGIGLYKTMLEKKNFLFAKQAGCTHVVVHLVNYYTKDKDIVQTTDESVNYGVCDSDEECWSLDGLRALRKEVEEAGLVLHAIENFNPRHWYDILLDGPKKREQMDHLKRIITNVGKAGIPVFGYNFSIAGVWGHTQKPQARGGAMTATFDYPDGGAGHPIPDSDVWNMTVRPTRGGFVPPTSPEELWARCEWFLHEILPVAEEFGVRMAAHPDDPPMPFIRGQARLVYQPRLYQKLIDLNPSPSNCLEFCMGSIQEMAEGCVYEAIEQYASQDRIAYIHFRNVRGKVPNYEETFVDDGDIDMIHALRLLKKHNYKGVLIPDHTPQLTCDAPWHGGMAYALGYMKAAIAQVEKE